jgi:hypothetical protein
MIDEPQNPQINSAKIPIGGNIIGAIVAAGSMGIFLIGLPVLWYAFPAAIAVGCAVALAFRLMRHKTVGASWILK